MAPVALKPLKHVDNREKQSQSQFPSHRLAVVNQSPGSHIWSKSRLADSVQGAEAFCQWIEIKGFVPEVGQVCQMYDVQFLCDVWESDIWFLSVKLAYLNLWRKCLSGHWRAMSNNWWHFSNWSYCPCEPSPDNDAERPSNAVPESSMDW